MQATDGNFYGTTAETGPTVRPCGTVFKITPSGTLTTLYSFCSQAVARTAAIPARALVQATDGNFYGTTELAGPTTAGTVFKITPSGTLTTLYSFCSQGDCTDGETPSAGLVQATDGNFYGTTSAGGDQATAARSSSLNALLASLSSSSVSFGSQVIHTTSTARNVTLTTNGVTKLTISSITISGTNAADFAQTNNCPATLLPGNKCTISVKFTPSILGKESATLEVLDSAANSPQSAALSGTGVAPATLTPASANFGNVAIATSSSPKNFTLRNNQSVVLTISSIGATGVHAGDFSESDTCGGTVAAKSSCTVAVTFSPSVLGSETATLTVNEDAPAPYNTLTAPLLGKGVVQVSVTPASLSFPAQTVGTTSAAMSVTLTNNLNTTLGIGGITFTGAHPGDFAETDNCGGPASQRWASARSM